MNTTHANIWLLFLFLTPFVLAQGINEPRLAVGEVVHVSKDRSTVPHVEPHIAAHPTDPDRFVGASITFDSTGDDVTTTFASHDGGRSWSRTDLTPSHIDPWVSYGVDGRAFVACLHRRVVKGIGERTIVDVRSSTNGGVSWLPHSMVPFGKGSSSDRVVVLTDNTHGPNSGMVYVVRGQAYDYFNPKPGYCERCWYGPSVARSTDNGRTFSDPTILQLTSLDNQLANADLLFDGSLVILYFDFQQGGKFLHHQRSWVILSTDGGRTFSAPMFVCDKPASAITVDRSSLHRDRLYVVLEGTLSRTAVRRGSNFSFNHSTLVEPMRSDVYLLASNDRGNSWSDPVKVNDAVGEAQRCALPTVAVNRDGIVGVLWADTRNDPNRTCYDMYFSASVDGGATFLPNVRLTDRLSCPETSGNLVKTSSGDTTYVARRWPYGGDYQGLTSSPDGSFFAFWADSRTGVFQIWARTIRVEQ